MTPGQLKRKIAALVKRNRARGEDLTGLRCGTLMVIRPTNEYSCGKRRWLCQCECGKRTKVVASLLKHGKQKSCGCKTREILSKARTVHGETDSRTWKAWKNMRDRCLCPSHKSFRDYGGRGIKVCEKWMVYSKFREDMGVCPEGLTLGRIDNGGNYEKGNCRWESRKQQARNRRSSVTLTFGGITATVVEWSERIGIEQDSLYKRLEAGWTEEETLTRPPRVQKNSVSKWNPIA